MKTFRKFLAAFLTIAMVISATLPNLAMEAVNESSETSFAVEETTVEETTTEETTAEETTAEESTVGAFPASPEEEDANEETTAEESTVETTRNGVGASTASPEAEEDANEETTIIDEEAEEDVTAEETTAEETTVEATGDGVGASTANPEEEDEANEETTAEETTAEETTVEEMTAEETTAEETTAEETTAEETTAEETTAEETTAEETTTEESTVEASPEEETSETLNVVDEEIIATKSNLNKNHTLGATYWCYLYVDDSDPDNIIVHYSGTEPANWSSIPTGKKGSSSTSSLPSISSTDKTSIKTAVFDDAIDARTANGWFNGFTNLTTITNISNLNTSSATSMYNMFKDCSSLTSVDLHELDTSSITTMAYMFKGCTNLANVNVSGLDTSKVTTMEYMFQNCTSLTNVDISGLGNNVATKFQYMFDGCTSLTDVTMSNLFSSSVLNINASYMFRNCTSLTTPVLSGLNMGNVSNMSYMFDGCTALTSIDFSNTTTGAVTTVSYMFRNCTNLVSLNLSNFVTTNVTGKSDTLKNCDNLRTLNLSAGFASIINSTSLKGDWKKSTSDTIYEYKSSKTTIPAEAGEYLRAYKITFDSQGGSVVAPIFKTYNESLALTNPMRPGFTFDGWYNEAEYTNPVVSPITVTGERTIYAKWSGGEGITLVYWGVGKKNNSRRTLYLSMKELYIGYTYEFVGSFANAADFNSETDVPWHTFRSEIYSVSVQSNVSPTYFKCKSMAYWFKDMTKLTFSSLSSLTNHNDMLESIAHIFEGCTNLTSITTISVSNNFKNMDSAFKNCSKVRVIQTNKLFGVPTSSLNIVLQNGGFKDAFVGCTNLRRVNLRYIDFSSYTGDVFSFAGLTSLVRVRVKNSGNLFNRVNLSGEWWEYASGNKYTSSNMPANVAQIRKYETFSNTIYWYIQGEELHLSSTRPSNANYKNGHYFNGDEANAYGMLPMSETITAIVLDNTITIRNGAGSSFFENLNDMVTEIRNISYLNTSEVTDMNYMFGFMTELRSIDLSSLDTQNVTIMTGMFNSCEKLQTLDLSSFNTSKVTNMDGMFQWCPALRSVNLSSFNTSRVTDMSTMFEDCSSLETLDLSSFSTESLDDGDEYNDDGILWMFDGCSSLRTIYVSNNFVITYNPGFADTAFDGCNNLVGGNGTTYSDAHIYADYACIDTAGRPGYFTYKSGPTPGPTPESISNIAVDTAPNKISYDVGEMFNPTGLKIRVNYSTGRSNVVTYDNSTKNSFSFDPSLSTALTEANRSVTITYGGKTCRQNITVTQAKQIASISVVRKPNATSYFAGYSLNPTGLIIKAYYVDNTTENITYSLANADRFTFNPSLTTRLSTNMTEVVVTYKGSPASFSISVIANNNNSGSSSSSSGGSDSGSDGVTNGPIPSNIPNLPGLSSYTPTTTAVATTKTISGVLDSSSVNWAVNPETGKWILGATINGQAALASNGFFQISTTSTRFVNGVPVQNQVNDVYYFDATGSMVTGWVKTADDKWYFFENAKTANEGKMQLGWKNVQGTWFFFGPDGAMFQNQVTPDGYVVGADGRWVQV